MVVGIGDDAAVLAAPDSRVVASVDLLVENQHFRRDWSTATETGGKAAAQNLSDIAAMGAQPTALLVGLAAPGDLPVAWAEDLATGLAQECSRVGATVAGGDISAAPLIMVAVTALGDLGGRPPVTRAGARRGRPGRGGRPARSLRGRPGPAPGRAAPGPPACWPSTAGRTRTTRPGRKPRRSARPR